jgi:hypothetical protein
VAAAAAASPASEATKATTAAEQSSTLSDAATSLRSELEKLLSLSKTQEADLNKRALENAEFVKKFGNRVNLGSVVPLIDSQKGTSTAEKIQSALSAVTAAADAKSIP